MNESEALTEQYERAERLEVLLSSALEAIEGLVGWFEEHDGVADDWGELKVVKAGRETASEIKSQLGDQ